MITRLQIDGFKNLVDVDIHFGKFNVITGANGVGKSNLFDAIKFVSLLITKSIFEAAKEIRGSERNFNQLFTQLSKAKIINFQIAFGDNNTEFNYNLSISGSTKKAEISDEKLINSQTGEPIHDYKTGWTETPEHSILNTFRSLLILDTKNDFKIHNWKIFNLSSKYLRQEDSFNDSFFIGEHGDHIPATLYRLTEMLPISNEPAPELVLSKLSNRLFELTGEIKEIRVRRFEEIEKIWIEIKGPDGVWHNARALSDGTLRFLALAVLWLDPEARGVFCIEEPENGIHPSKIPALMRLLRDISEKPGCQVIVNTHSPALVAQTPAEDIIVAYPVQRAEPDGRRYTFPRFAGLKGTWRQDAGMHVATISQVMDYLDPVPQRYEGEPLRLLDREDARRLMERRRARTWEVTED